MDDLKWYCTKCDKKVKPMLVRAIGGRGYVVCPICKSDVDEMVPVNITVRVEVTPCGEEPEEPEE